MMALSESRNGPGQPALSLGDALGSASGGRQESPRVRPAGIRLAGTGRETWSRAHGAKERLTNETRGTGRMGEDGR